MESREKDLAVEVSVTTHGVKLGSNDMTEPSYAEVVETGGYNYTWVFFVY